MLINYDEISKDEAANNISIRSINTLIDFLAKYKFKDANDIIKLYNKVGVIIDKTIADKMYNLYLSNNNNKFKKSDLFELLNNNASPSNESENTRAFNLFLKKLENVKIEEFLQHIYPNEHNKNSERINNKKLVEKLFFDRNGNFKISSISKLF